MIACREVVLCGLFYCKARSRTYMTGRFIAYDAILRRRFAYLK